MRALIRIVVRDLGTRGSGTIGIGHLAHSEARQLIDLNKLRHMVAVAKYASFVRASEVLFISQPALSRSIQSLETSYGVRLFARRKNGLELTAEGREVLVRAEALLAHADAVERDLDVIASGSRRLVTFGIGPISGAMLLEGLLAAVVRESDLALSVRSSSAAELTTMLVNGEIEFFVGPLPKAADQALRKRLSYELLASNRVGIYVRPGHPLLDSDNERSVASFPLIAGSFVRSMLDPEDLAAVGVVPPVLEIDDYDMLLRLASASDALVVAPEPLLRIRSEYPFEELVPQVGPSLQVGIATLSDRPLSRAALLVADFFRDELARPGAD